MTTISVDVPVNKQNEYKKLFSKFVRDYPIKELEQIQDVEVDLVYHDISELTAKQRIAYENSFNTDDLINI